MATCLSYRSGFVDGRYSNLLRCLGFVLLLTANDLVLREPGLFIDSLPCVGCDLAVVRVSVNCAFFCSLLVIGLYSLYRNQECRLKAMVALQVFSLAIAVLLLVGAVFVSNQVAVVLAYAAVAFLGLFAGFGLMAWVAIYSEFDLSQVWFEIIVCLGVSALSYVSVFYAMTVVDSCALVLGVCAISLLYPLFAKQEGVGSFSPDEPPRRAVAIKENYPAVLCIAALNFLLTLSRALLGGVNEETVNLVCSFGLLLAAALLLIVYYGLDREFDIKLVYGIAFPLLALFFLLFPLLSQGGKLLFMLVSTVVGTAGSTLLFYIAFWSKRQFAVSSMGVYGVFSGFMHAVLLIGYFCGDFIPESEIGTVRYMVLCFVVVYVLTLVFMASRNRKRENDSSNVSVVFLESHSELERAIEAMSQQYKLSQREEEILGYLVLGESAESIAEHLCISKNTVGTHRKNIYKKMGVHSQQELRGFVLGSMEG